MPLSASQLELLAAAPPFEQLGADDLQRIAQLSEVVDLPAGTLLMRQGEPGTEMHIILEGFAAIDRNGARIAERGRGEVLGEMALLSDMPRTATVMLMEDSRLLRVPRSGFDALMGELPSFRRGILESLARRARDL